MRKTKKIKKIVITGGPCAGKSTAMSRIVSEFTNKGYKVLIVPETATELIMGGITPLTVSLKEFQKTLMSMQLYKEKMYEDIAQKVKEDNVLIVLDRGLLDNKAYTPKDIFHEILCELNLNEIKVRDSYDGVFHLITSAIGTDVYSTENNNARTETKEEAISLDNMTLDSWTGHPHLKVIDNSTDFETKINRLMIEIHNLLEKPIPVQIFKKYLIQKPKIDDFLKQIKNYEIIDIIQTYLVTDSDKVERRIRQRGVKGDYVFFYKEKKLDRQGKEIATERRINVKEYTTLMTEADIKLHQMIKTRYCFLYKNQYFHLDVYPFDDNYALLEIELTEKSQKVYLPKNISLVKDVSDDEYYKNREIAKRYILKD